jgi:hypothetical protein
VALHESVPTYLAVNEECPPTILVTPAVRIISTDCHSSVLVTCVGR